MLSDCAKNPWDAFTERTSSMNRTFLSLAVLAALVTSARAAGVQTPTVEQSLNLKTASGPRISPDGQLVAYQVQEADWTENAFKSEIWIATVNTGECYPLTHSKKSSSSPRWSPDGKRLAFLSDRDGKQQIYLIAPHGGEALPLTKGETGVSGFEWSPDGRHIAFTAVDPESKAQKERKEKYGDFLVVESDYTMTHLWKVAVPAEGQKMPEPERLTQGEHLTVGGFSWSPDSKRLAFSASRDPDLGSMHTSDIYVLNLSDKSSKKIVDTQGPDRNPHWSPDGTQIAFETADAQEFFYYTNSRIAVVPAEGGKPRVLTEAFDEQPRLIAWAPDGIYFSALQKTDDHLFRLNPSTKALERISKPKQAVFSQFSLTPDFKRAAFLWGDAKTFTEVAISSLASFEPKRLSTLGEQLKGFRLASREVIAWKSIDGTPIEGILLKPADYNPEKKYPLLVIIHGGPTGIDLPLVNADRYYPVERFVAKGALVLKPNYRGSAGYGEKFRAHNVRNLGVGDYADVISGVDHLVEQGLVDRDRVGAMGWSQGGYISAFITTSSDRFKAVSVGAGISNWMTYYVNTDIHPFTRQYLKATPWDDPEIYRKTSPISYLKTAKTPTLIQHGELDKRVPIPNAYELYQGLKDRGVPVKLVVYKGFGHGIDKPKQQRAVMEQNEEWFGQYLWGKKPAAAGK
jgi:dipeptidyl aminopeptidase/acylaminoacyl peptidase